MRHDAQKVVAQELRRRLKVRRRDLQERDRLLDELKVRLEQRRAVDNVRAAFVLEQHAVDVRRLEAQLSLVATLGLCQQVRQAVRLRESRKRKRQ